MADTSPRDREIERFKLHAAFHGYSLNPDPQGGFVRFSDLQAREAQLEKERDEARERCAQWSRDYDKAIAESDRIDNRVGELMRERTAACDRAEKAEAFVAEARAELERRADQCRDDSLEPRADNEEELLGRAAAFAEAGALLTATPCSDREGQR